MVFSYNSLLNKRNTHCIRHDFEYYTPAKQRFDLCYIASQAISQSGWASQLMTLRSPKQESQYEKMIYPLDSRCLEEKNNNHNHNNNNNKEKKQLQTPFWYPLVSNESMPFSGPCFVSRYFIHFSAWTKCQRLCHRCLGLYGPQGLSLRSCKTSLVLQISGGTSIKAWHRMIRVETWEYFLCTVFGQRYPQICQWSWRFKIKHGNHNMDTMDNMPWKPLPSTLGGAGFLWKQYAQH